MGPTQVLLRLCKDAEDEQDPEGLTANQQHHTTTTTTTTTTQRAREATLTASSLSAHDILSGKRQPDSSRRQEACHAEEKRDPDPSRGQQRQDQAAVAGEGVFVPNEAVYKCESGLSLLRGRFAEGSVSSKAVYESKGGVPTPPSCRLAERFVSKEAVFRAVLRQMRVGTPASTVAAAEVIIMFSRRLTRPQKFGFRMCSSSAAVVIAAASSPIRRVHTIMMGLLILDLVVQRERGRRVQALKQHLEIIPLFSQNFGCRKCSSSFR